MSSNENMGTVKVPSMSAEEFLLQNCGFGKKETETMTAEEMYRLCVDYARDFFGIEIMPPHAGVLRSR